MTSTVVREPLAPPGPARSPVAGVASLTLRELLDRPRCVARVIAVFPSAVYVEMRSPAEPRVLAVVGSDAVRLPNAIVVAATSRDLPFAAVREGDDAWVGDGVVEVTGAGTGGGPTSRLRIRVRTRRWWDPSPVLGPVSPAQLAHGALGLAAETSEERCGLADHPGPGLLAGRCADGDLAHAVDAAERIVGLGPGLTPTGDDILAGLLVSLRLLGGSVHGGDRAVWLADWLGAAVTAHAGTRTTALAATLLHCASRGQAGAEVAAVLRGIAGQVPLRPAVRRLLGVGHTSGADLTWGLLAGCRATLALATEAPGRRRVTA
ncbi:DUF2877 domain-containing protein [Actinomadura sp. HBU206391]|uniref:DUF2877 domain-containing protein n=1 Tax=Actinomadura sp. HBU206391 TaxID=2731692 RepID=UPI002905DD74|nr:DUF2877 domain-containing protein [Actinomadura sp. HBU206391]